MAGKAWRTSQPESTSVLKDFFLAQGKGSPGHLLNGGDVGFNKHPEEFRFWLKEKTLQVTCCVESLASNKGLKRLACLGAG